jgi:CRISPR/Cas system CSM-associated protein Csm2 small subunit
VTYCDNQPKQANETKQKNKKNTRRTTYNKNKQGDQIKKAKDSKTQIRKFMKTKRKTKNKNKAQRKKQAHFKSSKMNRGPTNA